MFGNGELIEYYRVNLLLINEHGFSLSEIENMTPYEREVYILILMNYLQKKKEAASHG
jgi:hypothetical protein